MKGPYGFELGDSCQNCKLRSNDFFCQLPQAALKDLNAIKFTSAYPAGAVLFIEKQTARGIYLLCEGEVKLSISSSEGKKLILRITKRGEVLGLVSALAGKPHEVTAETLRPCQVAFIPRDAFFASGDLGQRIVIIPSQRLVVVRLGDSVEPGGDIRGLAQLVKELIAATNH